MSPARPAAARPGPARLATYFHVHLVSDSTGETLNAMLKATASQFAAAKPLEHIYALIRSRSQMEKPLAEIEASVAFAEASPFPAPEAALEDVFAD